MLILNPRQVTFAAADWPNVSLLSIDRKATRLAIGWSDGGPYPTFADAPEQRVDVQILMEVEREDINLPRPGDQGTLSLVTSPTATDAGRRRIAMTAVITGIAHELSLRKGAVRTINLTAISPDGAADPITISDVTG